jgi:hypothetical protein
LKRFFSFILLIGLSLLLGTQPVLADIPLPIEIEAIIPYPISDLYSKEPHEIKLDTVFMNTNPTYIATGPLFSTTNFRYRWICPKGAYLIDGDAACYQKSNITGEIVLIRPVAAQIAFAYELDEDITTNEQLVYLAIVPKEASSPAPDSLLADNDDDTDKPCKNRRQCLQSYCGNNKWVMPPTPCPLA